MQLSRRIRGPAGPLAIVVGLALLPGSAWAAPRNSLAVSGPRQAQAGQRVKLHFTGYARTEVRRLRVWLDDRKCAATAKGEGNRTGLRAPTQFRVRRHFRALLTIKRSAKGTHVVCAYLVHRRTRATVARASWRYITK